MAKPVTLAFSNVLIQLGDGEVSEAFAAPCALTDKSFTITTESTETVVPDCSSPDLATWVERTAISKSAEISGSGVLAAADLDEYRGWVGTTKNVRLNFDVSAANNGGYYQGAFILNSFTVNAVRGEKASVTLSAQSAGDLTFTAAS